MFSIGDLSRRTGVKVPTIRYYETRGLMPAPERSTGNQRRYGRDGLARLSFIRHARDLGFTLEAIAALISLQSDPDRSCAEADALATDQLNTVRAKIARLQRLEQELARITHSCQHSGTVGTCDVMASLADHDLCDGPH